MNKAKLMTTHNIFVGKTISDADEREKFGRILTYLEAIDFLARRDAPEALMIEATVAQEVRLEESTWKKQPRISIFK